MTTFAGALGMVLGNIIFQAIPHYFLLQEMRKQHEQQIAELKRQFEKKNKK
jgi:hypothetical protein